MKMRWRTVLACLVLGAATTIVLAWSLAFARPLPRESPRLFQIDGAGDAWMGFGQQGPGWRAATLYGASGLTAVGRASAADLPDWIRTPSELPIESRAVTTIGAGWPMVALRATRTGVGHDEPLPGSNAWHTGLGPQWVEWRDWEGALVAHNAETANDGGARVLPICVHATGFSVDVLFWTLIWSLPPILLSFRRMIRRRHGACLGCGYDLHGVDSGVCPECGRPRTTSA